MKKAKFSTPYSPIKTRSKRHKINSGDNYEPYIRWTVANKES